MSVSLGGPCPVVTSGRKKGYGEEVGLYHESELFEGGCLSEWGTQALSEDS